jgi:hypothetical protein
MLESKNTYVSLLVEDRLLKWVSSFSRKMFECSIKDTFAGGFGE